MKNVILVFLIGMALTSCGSSLSTVIAKDDYSFKKSSATSKYDKSQQPKKAPIALDNKFIWGTNGHPIDSRSYYKDNSLSLQFNLLKEFQMTYYRVNVITDENGQVNMYTTYPKRWEETLKESVKKNIKILPVFHLKDYDPTMTEAQAYKAAKQKALGFVSVHKEYFDYYELGNEKDIALLLPNTSGDKVEDYDLEAFDILIAYFRGLHDGVKEADPTAKTLINSAGWKHWGFFEYLKQKEVPYDIISWHWYSNQGTIYSPISVKTTGEDVLKLLNDRFNKPIWITEINQIGGTFKESEDNMAFWSNSFIDDLKNRDYVKAYFVYELLNQPHLDDKKGYENPKEAYYGLIKWNEPHTTYSYKSAAITYKYKIEDIAHGSEDYILQLYSTFDRAKPNTDQLLLASNQVKDEAKLSLFLDSFLSQELIVSEAPNSENLEAREIAVNQLYNKLLERGASSENQKYWQKKIKKGSTLKEVMKSLLSSKEFYQKAIIAGYEKRTGFPFYREGVYDIQDQK